MDMVDLIVTVCTLVQPQACHDQHMLFESHGSLASCMAEAQPYLAQWEAQHPKVQVTRWRCEWPDQEKGST